jgi:hypothetical protein
LAAGINAFEAIVKRWQLGISIFVLAGILGVAGYLLAERLSNTAAAMPNAGIPSDGDIYTTHLEPLEYGRRLYSMLCISCHQPDGMGLAGQYPPLNGSEWVRGPDFRLKRILLHGLTGPVHVSGRLFNNTMPAVGDRWDDARIAAVLTYVRNQFGQGSPAITTSAITDLRARLSGRLVPWTEAELLAVSNENAITPASATPSTHPAGR